jgi:hypothetical protein
VTTVTGRRAGGRHRREPDPYEDDEPWLDPRTRPLAVYADRDLPFAPVAVQRDRGRVVTRR